MPKRSAEEKIKHYLKKIKKLEQPAIKKKRCRIIMSSDDEIVEECQQDQTMETQGDPIDLIQEVIVDPDPPLPKDPDLDPELLLALGESTSDSPDFGEKILESQAKLWLPLLKKGMPKESKEILLKEYNIPDNCRLLQAPKLNPEIAAAIPDMVRNRDKNTLCVQQQQLGSGITAVNRAMDVLLLNGDKIQTLRHLSNGCRLLMDLHSLFTQCRTKLITPSLDKTCLNVIHDAERDETLFGAQLGEKIKTAKAIERQGHQIKRAQPQKQAANTSQHFQFEIYTDASGTGWGAVCNDSRANGMWSSSERDKHINYLELLAIFLGLKSFVRLESNCTVLLRVDNTTAISYINRMGGIQFPHLNELSRLIWQWCEERDIWIVASYVNTKDNRADFDSRIVNPDTEWELSNKAFDAIKREFGEPEIDLFASRTNAKCEQFVSWKPDPDAMTVDAFTINWQGFYFYAFPPFSLLLKCLRKIIDDKATGVLVFPYWPSQPWFPLLKKLIRSDIFYIDPYKFPLQSLFRDMHPLRHSLTLAAARLCGKLSLGEAPQPTL